MLKKQAANPAILHRSLEQAAGRVISHILSSMFEERQDAGAIFDSTETNRTNRTYCQTAHLFSRVVCSLP